MEKTTPGLRQQNPLVFYLHTLLYMLMALLLRLVTFAPLATLFLPSDVSFWPWLSLLCPLLFFFLLLPLRFSFAQALVQNGGPRRFRFDVAFSLTQYGEKLWRSFVHFLSVLKWFIPLGVAGVYGWLSLQSLIYDQSFTEIFTPLSQLGLWTGNVVSGIGTFFRGLFGNPVPLEIHGGLMEGLMALGVILAVLLLLIVIGMMRNSATRYVWAYAAQYQRNPRSENRRRVQNRRWVQLGFALLNLLLWAPFLVALGLAFSGDFFGELAYQLMPIMGGQPLDITFFTQKIGLGQLLLAFLVCYLPFLPLRRMITAFFATKSIRFAQPSPLGGPVRSKLEGLEVLQEEDEEGLPPLAQSQPMPEPVPAWPAPQDWKKHSAPYQPSLEEQDPDALREAPGEEAPEAVAQAQLAPDQPEAEAPKTTPAPPQASGEPPRQDVEPSAFTIGQ